MKRVFVLFGFVLMIAGVLGLSFDNPTNKYQFQQPSFNNIYSGDMGNYWPILNNMKNGKCEAVTDFVIGIPPGGCSPSVVRSDLLAEQNVPVFCQLYAIKINPSIKVSSINSISFKGDYPEGVRSIVFHPARAAVKSYSSLLGDPVLNNIGYVVIILKQEKVEANMEKWILGNLTATMKYDAEEAYGVGRGEYYLQDMNNDDWNRVAAISSFWNGKGYLRASEIEGGKAKIDVMSSKDDVVRSFNLKVGESSDSVYLPGFYCKAGLKVKLNKIVGPEDMALLNVDGEEIWVRKGSKFLNGKCRVSKMNVRSNNDGDVDIRCNGAGKMINLELRGVGAVFEVEGKKKEFALGDTIKDNWRLAYVGNYPVSFDKDKTEISILVNGRKSKESGIFYSEIEALEKKRGTKDDFVKELKSRISSEKFGNFMVIEKEGVKEGLKFLGADKALKDKEFGGVVDEYFKRSVKVVKDELIEDYRLEEQESGEKYGEGELLEEIILAGKLGKLKTEGDLMDLFIETYPLSSLVDEIRRKRQKMESSNFDNSMKSVYVGNSFRSISLVDLKVSDRGERKVDLRVGPSSFDGLEVGDIENIGQGRKFEIKDIKVDSVKIHFESNNPKIEDKTVRIKEGDRYNYEGVEIYVKNVEVDEVAFVSLIPNVKHSKSDANFSFKIGVEQREILLSPEKARGMIKNLDKSIKDWEKKVESLGKIVKGLKGACFATSAVLMVKNMAFGLNGKAAARRDVMQEYKIMCKEKFPEKSSTECYNYYKDEIEKSVSARADSYNAVNEKMQSAQKGNVEDSGGLFGGKGIVNNEKYRKDLVSKIEVSSVLVEVGGENPIEVKVDKRLSVSQLQSILMWEDAKTREDAVNLAKAKKDMDRILRNVALADKRAQDSKDAADKLGIDSLSGDDVILLTNKETRYVRWTGKSERDLGLDGEKKVQVVKVPNGKIYLIVLDNEVRGGRASIEKVMIKTKGGWKEVEDIPSSLDNVIFLVAGSVKNCVHSWPKGKAKVRYYDIGKNKGLPAIVPFDLEEGWYALVSNSAGSLSDDSPQGYRASGEVRSFEICNIGKNGLMQNGNGDDLCQSFDANSAGSVDVFIPCPGKGKAEIARLYSRAQEAIRKAANQYGEKFVNIFDERIEVGKSMSSVDGVECQDFMSPSDCKLMFNVCDPVICPPSRCNFGGEMPVSDVVQTGVIGSILLCLPNAKDGVMLPVCLSGIHAGLDAYLSILKSERDCLQHSLESGELVGICDEISAVYKCEFFWRQLSPLMDRLVPWFINSFMYGGNNVRGGGEYALVDESWKSMQQGISFFKNSYAQNAFKAFRIRSMEDVGSTFCKAFIGTSVPNSASVLDSLIEPESPSQFYAQFSERLFSEATVPATSQYKVYFHIYAGKDQGVQYKVYLKNPPASSYYKSNPSIPVKSGYITKGESADESVDFTAPAGYKELCVVVNSQEECGFKSVTSDFGLNWVKDKYVEDQAMNENIRTEKECISGTPSALSVANLNIQNGVEEAVHPEIALRGIVRICASENPEAGVVGEDYVYCNNDSDCFGNFKCEDGKCSKDGNFQKKGSRWKAVGYCGDSRLRCWLDTDSVKNDLGRLEVLSGVSNKILNERRGLIENERLGLEDVQKLLAGIRARIKSLLPADLVVGKNGDLKEKVSGIINDTYKISGKMDFVGAGTNNDRAEALGLEASVWRLISGEAFKNWVEPVVKESSNNNEDEEDCRVTCKDFDYGIFVDDEEDCVGDFIDNCCCSDKEKKKTVKEKEEVKEDCNSICTGIKGGGYGRGRSVEDTSECGHLGGFYYEKCCCFEKDREVSDFKAIIQKAVDKNYLDKNCLKYVDLVEREAKKYNKFDGLMLFALMQKESKCNHSVFSGSSYGLMQISSFGMCKGIGVNDKDDIFGVKTEGKNIECGALILNAKYREGPKNYECNAFKSEKQNEPAVDVWYSGIDYALRGYNGWGCAGYRRDGSEIFADHDYVEKIKMLYGKLKQISGEKSDGDVEVSHSENEDGDHDSDVSKKIERIEISYNKGIKDFLEYRWANGKVEARVSVGKFFGGLDVICNWENVCNVNKENGFYPFEKNMHNHIMNQGSWRDVISKVKEYDLGSDDLSVEYFYSL